MAQPTENLKWCRTGTRLAGLAVLSVYAAGCESISRDAGGKADLPPAPATVDIPAAVADAPVASASAAERTMPEMPVYEEPSAYGDGADDYWKAAEANGLVVTESDPSEYTRRYLNGEYARPATTATPVSPSPSGFSGETYSVVSSSAGTAPRYVTADGQPYPEEYNDIPPASGGQQFATASDAYTPAPRRATPAYATGGVYGVHLASYKVEANALKGWQTLSRRYNSLLGALEPRLSYTEVPGKGTYLRLKAGPFASRAEAADVCGAVKAAGDYCAVMTFDGTAF